MSDRVIVALDFPRAEPALALADRLGPACTFYKVGLELYTAEGAAVVRALCRRGKHVFLDLKLHDIPNTVARATARAGDLGARFLTVHAAGGAAMLEAAAAAAPDTLTLLGVTVLTSLDESGLGAVFGRRVPDAGVEAARLARMARGAG
ncbi:MAG: orotidine-5'-phosphate decarboxylase, partial [Gemmatimonadetes bacterium]|nr:orotidine-5'-phosphate decarboxylase [Gemmatimonadota bacterium]